MNKILKDSKHEKTQRSQKKDSVKLTNTHDTARPRKMFSLRNKTNKKTTSGTEELQKEIHEINQKLTNIEDRLKSLKFGTDSYASSDSSSWEESYSSGTY